MDERTLKRKGRGLRCSNVCFRSSKRLRCDRRNLALGEHANIVGLKLVLVVAIAVLGASVNFCTVVAILHDATSINFAGIEEKDGDDSGF